MQFENNIKKDELVLYSLPECPEGIFCYYKNKACIYKHEGQSLFIVNKKCMNGNNCNYINKICNLKHSLDKTIRGFINPNLVCDKRNCKEYDINNCNKLHYCDYYECMKYAFTFRYAQDGVIDYMKNILPKINANRIMKRMGLPIVNQLAPQRGRGRSRSRERHRSRSPDHNQYKSHERHRSRSHEHNQYRSHERHRSRSPEHNQYRSRNRDRSRSRNRDRSRSRNRDRSRSRDHNQYRSRNRDRSRSRDREVKDNMYPINYGSRNAPIINGINDNFIKCRNLQKCFLHEKGICKFMHQDQIDKCLTLYEITKNIGQAQDFAYKMTTEAKDRAQFEQSSRYFEIDKKPLKFIY